MVTEAAKYYTKIEHKERYLVALLTPVQETKKLLNNLSMRKVGEYERVHVGTYPKLYEIELDLLIEPLGPWGWLVTEEHERANNLTVEAKKKELSSISDQKPNMVSSPCKRDSTGRISRYDPLTDDDPVRDDKSLRSKRAFFSHHGTYESGGNQNAREETEVQRAYHIKMEVCPNPKCICYSKRGNGNIVFNGTYRTKEGTPVRRFLCKACSRVFCSRGGSLFYGLRSPEEKVLRALKLLVTGMPLRSVAKFAGVKLDTVRHWLKNAADQSGKIDSVLIKALQVSQGELDALWAFVKSNSLRQRAILWKKRN